MVGVIPEVLAPRPFRGRLQETLASVLGAKVNLINWSTEYLGTEEWISLHGTTILGLIS